MLHTLDCEESLSRSIGLQAPRRDLSKTDSYISKGEGLVLFQKGPVLQRPFQLRTTRPQRREQRASNFKQPFSLAEMLHGHVDALPVPGLLCVRFGLALQDVHHSLDVGGVCRQHELCPHNPPRGRET